MTDALQIHDRRERALVRLADLALSPLGALTRPGSPSTVQRILLLRLERIGDLLMTLDAIRLARTTWPRARIDLAVGEWNAPLAALIQDVDRLEILSVPWLARGTQADSWPALLAKARAWRARRFDVAINFEPDIRSNLLMWWSGAPVRAGYSSGGGAAFLTSRAPYDPDSHVSVNAQTLIHRVASITGADACAVRRPRSRLAVPDEARAAVRSRLANVARPLIGIHVSGGRESKQWHLDRFADVGQRLGRDRRGTIVLTGTSSDRPMVDAVKGRLRDGAGGAGGDFAVIDAAGNTDLVALAALLHSLDLLITGDTGPMHLAAAVGTPVVALFGPSDPARYGPRAALERVLVASEVPCRPCGQVRLPPRRCRGHVPDCLDALSVDRVVDAANALLDERRTDDDQTVSA